MAEFQITDADLSRSKFEGKVVIVTGNFQLLTSFFRPANSN